MTEFADLHQPGKPLFLPNAWDFASAAELVRAGYTTIGTTSLGVAAAAGKPDSTGVAAAETLAVTKLLARLPILLTVDLEAGHSDDPAEVADLATQLADAGAVGINLEDSRPDLTLDDPARHAAKIAAIKAAVPDLFVNARTDTFWLSDHSAPPPVDETLRRANAYIDAGADGIFVPGAADIPTVEALTSAIKAPLNVLYLSGQHTFGELAAAGVARVSTGSLLFRTALGAAIETAKAAHHGTVPPNPHRPTYEQIQSALTSH